MERNDESLSTRDLVSPSDSRAHSDTGTEPQLQQAESPTSRAAPAPDDQSQAASIEDAGMDRQAQLPAELSDGPSRSRQAATQGQEVDSSPSATATVVPASEADTGPGEPLLTPDLSSSFHRRWEEVQTRFVDEPRGAVEEADGLVANLMQQLAEGFAQERERLEQQWDRGEDISTEDLRVALKRYRSFFQRLLST